MKKHEHENLLSGLLAAKGKEEARKIRHIVIVGCIVNAFLMILKLLGGHYGHSDALVADGFHSLNDFAADLIMLMFIGISFRSADGKYSYGYGKFETFSTFLISLFLLFVAGHVAVEAVESISEYAHGMVLPQPDIWTVVIVIVSMCAKEFLFRYYRHGSQVTDTPALLSNAWHHRSDALASVATLIGVSFSHFFGESFRILDPCASLLLVVFIIVAACRMIWPAFTELMDVSAGKEICSKARDAALATPDVRKVLEVKSRKNGHFLIFDMKIGVDPHTTVEESEIIISAIRERMEKEFGPNIMLSVSTAPCADS